MLEGAGAGAVPAPVDSGAAGQQRDGVARNPPAPAMAPMDAPGAAGTASPGEAPPVSLAFGLGWQVAAIGLSSLAAAHGTLDAMPDSDALIREIARPRQPGSGERQVGGQPTDKAGDRPDAHGQLASLGELASRRPGAILIPQLSAGLAQLQSHLAGVPLPSVQELETACGGAEAGQVSVAACLVSLHERLATALLEADTRMARAYDLGRELAYLTQAPRCWPEFRAAAVRDNDLRAPLADLSTAFPAHAARAVALSLAAWEEWLAAGTSDPWHARALARAQALRPDPAKRPLWKAARPAPSQGRPASPSSYLRRQGQVWRALLTGEKAVRDTMGIENYEKVAHQAFRRAGSLFWRFVWTNKWALLIVLALLTGGTYAVTAVHGAAKVITFGTAVIGVFGITAKSASVAIGRAATKLGEQVWGAEIDIAAAQAITQLPESAERRLRFEALSRRNPSTGPAFHA